MLKPPNEPAFAPGLKAQLLEQLSHFVNVGLRFASERNLETLLAVIADETTQILDAQRSSLFLIDRERGEMWAKVAQGLPETPMRFPLGCGVAGWVGQTGTPLAIADAYADPRFNPEIDRRTGFRTRTVLCAPMRNRRGEILGVVQALNKNSGAFTSYDLTLLTILATQAAVAVENAELYEKLQAFNTTLGELVEERTRALRESEARFRRFLEWAPDPVLIAEADGRIVIANERAHRLFGCAPDALATSCIGERIPDLEGANLLISDVALAPRVIEAHAIRPDGGIFAVEVSLRPFEDEGGRLAALIVRDVTERKLAEQARLQGKKLESVGLLAAGVAHEINTPLASIALRAESLLHASEDPTLLDVPSFARFPKYLKCIDEEVFRCKRIVEALLDFSRGSVGQIAPADINAAVDKAFTLLCHQFDIRRVRLVCLPDLRIPPIEADEHQVRQVLVALLMNALDATAAGGEVVVRTGAEPSCVWLRVADSGSGIPQADLHKIFDPFYTTKPRGKGTGLGLAVCHGIMKSHGGTIAVESDVGKGAVFTLRFPRRVVSGPA